MNKIDLVDFDRGAVRRGRERVCGSWPRASACRRSDRDPDRAPHGDNVVERSERTPWYDGPTLLEYLETVDVAGRPRHRPPAPAGAVGLAAHRRAAPRATPAGSPRARCASATRSWSLPVGHRRRRSPRSTPSTTSATRPCRRCRCRSSSPTTSTSAAATCSSAPRRRSRRSPRASSTRPSAGSPTSRCAPGRRLALKHSTRTVRATVQAIHERARSRDARDARRPGRVGAQRHRPRHAAHELGRRRRPVRRQPGHRRVHPDRRAHQRHGRRRASSSRPREVKPGAQTARNDIRGTRRRWTATTAGERIGQRGATIWLTGLPASGKSTIAVALERASSSPARSPTCSTATTSATACPTTSASRPATAPRTSAASAMSRGCSPTPAWSRSSRWCRR